LDDGRRVRNRRWISRPGPWYDNGAVEITRADEHVASMP
jgi:hypothetical protein